ncbi:MAG TPA: hypothetical protein O0X87_00610, partial [Methanocorpusculum sp.]|nr:hypothetical protein [Methanocorpusculum sp.]
RISRGIELPATSSPITVDCLLLQVLCLLIEQYRGTISRKVQQTEFTKRDGDHQKYRVSKRNTKRPHILSWKILE